MSEYNETTQDDSQLQKPINFNRLFKDELASGSDDDEDIVI